MMYQMTEGYRLKYLLSFSLQIINVITTLFASYISMILIDVLSNEAPKGLIDTFITNLLGGTAYLGENIYILAIIVVVLALLSAVLSVVRHRVRFFIDVGIRKRNHLRIFKQLQLVNYAYLKTQKSGDIIQIATRDEDTIRRFIVGQITMISHTIFIVLFSFLLLLDISLKLAVSMIILLPFLAILSFFIVKEVRKKFLIADESESVMTSNIEENIRGTRTVKAFNNEQYEVEKFELRIDDYKKKLLSSEKVNSVYIILSDILIFSQINLTTVYGIYLAYTSQINIGALFLGIGFVSQIVWPVRSVASILSDLAKANAAMDRMNRLLSAPIEDLFSGCKPEIDGSITFNNMSFSYPDGSINALSDISFKINPGETVAIMGKTGSGKSTLSHLLSRLYDYTEGSIKFGHTELNTINKAYLRKNVAVVLQEPFLFSKTILDNLKIVDQAASEESIVSATSTASIHKSITEFNKGYNTMVGEHGVTLSGGQKQRLAIARTLMKTSKVLIFDDSLSAVDTQTDFEIRNALKLRTKDNQTTTIIITHRISTAKDADLIVFLEGGRIVEMGNHQKLLMKKGIYREIFDIQSQLE